MTVFGILTDMGNPLQYLGSGKKIVGHFKPMIEKGEWPYAIFDGFVLFLVVILAIIAAIGIIFASFKAVGETINPLPVTMPTPPSISMIQTNATSSQNPVQCAPGTYICAAAGDQIWDNTFIPSR